MQTFEEEIPVSITCDVCKKEYFYDEPNSCMETQEFHVIRLTGGYGSVFGDGSFVKGDICQHCLKEKLGEFLILE